MLKACTTMSQKTTSPESGENSKLSGQGSDTLNLSSPSGEDLKVAIQDPGSETNNIRVLLSEFKTLYEHRLRYLELDTTATHEEVLQKKVNFLWSYVNDLADQNQVLVQTIEDLQKEADYKVSNRGMKLCTSDRILDVSEVDLRTLLLDELVGPAAHVPHSTGSLVQITSELEDLQIQLQTKDMVISDLERELGENFQHKQKTAKQALESSERLVYLQSELSCLQRIQKDSMKEIAEKDICITKLQVNNELLQQDGADARTQLSELNMRARELQEELKRREEEWRQREDKQRLKYEKELQKAQERRRQEQQEREEEWVKKVEEEEKKREEEWKRGIEEERKAHAQAVKKWAEKAAVLNSELAVSRKQVERQNRELSESHQKEETLLSEAKAKMVSLRGELSALFERRMEEKEAKINQLTEELNGVRQKMKEREEHVRHLDQDVVSLRATQDSLKGTLAMKEKHTQQLVQDIAQLKESRASLQSKLQTSECMLSDISETQDQTKTSLDTERQQRQQIQDQLDRANKEMEHLQQEITHVRHTTAKKIQKRENKMCTLVKELTESKKQHSECQKELLRREKDLEKLSEEMDELRAKMEDRSRESVHLNQTKERLEADLALSHEKLHTSHLEVAALEGEVRHLKHKVRRQQEESCQLSEKVRDIERLIDQKEREQQQLHDQLHIGQQQVETFEGKLKRQEVEMELLHQQLKGATEELNDASLQAQQQKETVAIFRQKYTAAIEKVHRVQGQVEILEEELKYSQQQLRESQLTTHSVKEELAEMEQRYKEKVGQWENSQEALDQFTDELQANQNLLRESQQKADHLQGLLGSLQEQAGTLKQQKLMLECDLRLFQQSHSHSDEEYISLLRHQQQLQKCCTEQVERLAECEKAILQMKSELERQAQEKVGLKQSLLASHHTHMSNRGQLEQEVIRLKKEVTRLELELADTQKVHVALLRQSEEELKEARREAARRSSEVDAQRGEVQRLQEELLREEEKIRSAIREKQSLSTRVRQLSQELEELRCQLQVTVEELAARAGEARRMEGCLNEGKLAEGKIRSMAVRLEREVAELRRNLQQAVDHKVKAERDAQDAQDQVDTLRSELEGTRSDNANLRHESQLVMTNVSHWITEQKASNESLTAQMKAQNKVLLIVTEEKEHLQDGYDTLKEEVKRLKEVAAEKERDMEHFKAQIRDQRIRQDERAMEKQGCVALNLSKIEDMQTRLRSNLEAIGMLNQQSQQITKGETNQKYSSAPSVLQNSRAWGTAHPTFVSPWNGPLIDGRRQKLLNWLSRENKRLRRQLEEERSMRRQVERLLPPPPLLLLPPPPSTSLSEPAHLLSPPPYPHPSASLIP
ncbi:trichohyalin-like isoform X2 [Perca fluviatilis]|uniref:trichohyalin-like isoform X2 n=1 Tax=Perca fluviatilis TaxID=8168 RepID=UPI00196674E4|nr:trichohyalin-like isoform X2 [Perca fluviatilis]